MIRPALADGTGRGVVRRLKIIENEVDKTVLEGLALELE